MSNREVPIVRPPQVNAHVEGEIWGIDLDKEDELSERDRLLEMGCALDIEYPDEEDFLSGVTCNPDAPEECESCQ